MFNAVGDKRLSKLFHIKVQENESEGRYANRGNAEKSLEVKLLVTECQMSSGKCNKSGLYFNPLRPEGALR